MTHAPTSSSGKLVAIQRITPYGEGQPEGRSIAVRSAAFAAGAVLPVRQSAYDLGLSPPLQWSPVPGAAAWALILEDPDAPRDRPFLHWAIWNIPAEVTALTEGVAPVARPDWPAGAFQGRNDSGSVGYFGPKPPPGDHPHRYHFQVFALGAVLGLEPDADLDALIDTLKGDVIASGELIGLYQQPDA